MDVVKQFYHEALELHLQEINKKSDQVLDIVQLLMMSAEEGKNNQRAISQEVSEIKKTTDVINSKMDVVLEKLTTLEADFADLKNENREIEIGRASCRERV